MFPAESTATPCGDFSWALVAGPPSPENPGVPLPATRTAVPLESSRYTECSAVKYTVPEGSRPTLPKLPSARLPAATAAGAGAPPAIVDTTYEGAAVCADKRKQHKPSAGSNFIGVLDAAIETRVPLYRSRLACRRLLLSRGSVSAAFVCGFQKLIQQSMSWGPARFRAGEQAPAGSAMEKPEGARRTPPW